MIMNDMNDTLAEIRRRGETRIRARKQLRRRITALCVPLVLCVAALLTVPIQGQPTYEAKPAETVFPGEIHQYNTIPNTQVVVQDIHEDSTTIILKAEGENLERSYTDAETITAFQQLLNGWASSNSCASYFSEDESRAGVPAKENTTVGSIRLTFTDGEETREYILHSRSLYDVKEKVSYPISHAQYTAVMELLKLG